MVVSLVSGVKSCVRSSSRSGLFRWLFYFNMSFGAVEVYVNLGLNITFLCQV